MGQGRRCSSWPEGRTAWAPCVACSQLTPVFQAWTEPRPALLAACARGRPSPASACSVVSGAPMDAFSPRRPVRFTTGITGSRPGRITVGGRRSRCCRMQPAGEWRSGVAAAELGLRGLDVRGRSSAPPPRGPWRATVKLVVRPLGQQCPSAGSVFLGERFSSRKGAPMVRPRAAGNRRDTGRAGIRMGRRAGSSGAESGNRGRWRRRSLRMPAVGGARHRRRPARLQVPPPAPGPPLRCLAQGRSRCAARVAFRVRHGAADAARSASSGHG